MKTIKYALFALLSHALALQALANANLLDELKARNNSYSISTYCRNFIQSATHSTLVSTKIQNALTPLSALGLGGDYFFHYSDDEGGELAQAVKKKDFSPVMSYLFTTSNALGNVYGPGLYVAANPFSSAGYGNKQTILRVDRSAKLFNGVTLSATLKSEMTRLKKVHPNLGYCPDMITQTLILEENGTDIAYYSAGDEWFVTFNEDIFKSFSLIDMPAEDKDTIISNMVSEGQLDPLLGLISDFTSSQPSQTFSLDHLLGILGGSSGTTNPVLAIGPKIKNWSSSTKDALIGLTVKLEGSEFTKAVSYLTSKRGVPLSAFESNFQNTSKSYDNWLSGRIAANPGLLSSWDDVSYFNRMTALMGQKKMTLNQYITYATGTKVAVYYSSGLFSDLSDKEKTSAIELLIENHPKKFVALDQETQYAVFNSYLRSANKTDIPKFVSNLAKNSYGLDASFSFVQRKQNTFNNKDNLRAFLREYVLLKKDAALVSSDLVGLLVAGDSNSIKDYLVVILGQRSSFKSPGNLNPLIQSSIATLGKDASILLQHSYVNLLNDDERSSVMAIVLGDQNFDSIEFKNTLVLAMNTMKLSLRDVLAMAQDYKKVGVPQASHLVGLIENDSTLLGEFLDLSKARGVKDILLNPYHYNLSLGLMTKYRDHFFKDPDSIPSLPTTLEKATFTAANVSPYLSSYSETEKWRLAKRIMAANPGDHLNLMASITYSPAIMDEVLTGLMTKVSDKTLETLLNTESFVRNIPSTDFERLIVDASKAEAIDLSLALTRELFTFEQSLTILSKLKNNLIDSNLLALVNGPLKMSKLNESQKDALSSHYIQKFGELNHVTRDALWPSILAHEGGKEDFNQFSDILGALDVTKRNQVLLGHLRDLTSFQNSVTHFKNKGLDLAALTLEARDSANITKLFTHLAANYPKQLTPETTAYVVDNYPNIRSFATVTNFMEKFLCEKVNKHKAFSLLIDNETDKYKKRSLKDKRRTYCR